MIGFASDRDRAARWASRGELTELHATGPTRGRIALGEHNGKLIAAERRVSVLGVGPAQEKARRASIITRPMIEMLHTTVRTTGMPTRYSGR